jgi:hypothetical protein
MVQFPGCAFRTLCIQARMTGIYPVGLPHSAIRGSRDVCSSPRLIAAYHGLHRTAAPRHPPWTLVRLTILLFALQPGLQTPARLQPFRSLFRTCAASPSDALLKLSLRAPANVSIGRSRSALLALLTASRAAATERTPLHPSLALSKILVGRSVTAAARPLRARRGEPRGYVPIGGPG